VRKSERERAVRDSELPWGVLLAAGGVVVMIKISMVMNI
jgi:hypothetical protein